ncbi:MFS transporter [Fibrobacter succinogenes]|uniref:MFS transporter n=1 Tax=Fibrobacter succinogenes TaxID=833 RepID=UPI0026F0052D|nr:MFS transporter [Fibrobacter succinogenes]
MQLGLFIHFQRWITFNSEGTRFFWLSLLLQFAMFSPSIIMMHVASYFAGRFPKSKVMGWTSIGMSVSVLLIAFFFGDRLDFGAFALLFLYGIFLSIFNPAKIGLMKEITDGKDLVKINAKHLIFMALGITIISFLTFDYSPNDSSTISYSILPFILSAVGLVAAISSFCIRICKQNKFVKLRSPRRNFASTWSNPMLKLSMLGIAAFWSVTQFLIMISQNMTGTQSTTLFQWTFIFTGIGYIIGAISAAKSSKNFVETGLIPLAAIASSITMVVTPFINNQYILAFLYAFIAFWAGSAFVILRTVIQNVTRPDTSGRIHAVSFMIQMSFLFILLGFQVILFLMTELSLHKQLFFLAVILALTFVFTLKRTPMTLLRAGLRFAFSFVFRYRVKVHGIQNMPESGPLLLVGPHYSFIDWAVLQMASPRPLLIASNRNTFADWYLRWLSHGKSVIDINRRDPSEAMEKIHEALLKGEAVVIFPEGEVSKAPFISKFSLDYSKAIEGTEAQIVPFYIQGLWGSRYSNASESVNRPQYFNRTISVGFGKAMPATTSDEAIRNEIQILGSDIWNIAMDHSASIVPLWFRAMLKRRSRPILIDPAGNHVNGYGMIRLCHHFGKKIKSFAKNDQNVGFMLPTSRDAALGIMSILGTGKTSVNLNYTAPVDTLIGCIDKAELSTIVTTRAFFDKLCGKNPDFKNLAEKCKLIFLDEEEAKISTLSRLVSTYFVSVCPAKLLRSLWFNTSARLDDDAVILFSSGSEGTPKGVELTHKNVISNAQQCDYVVKLCRTDVMTSLLPLFHSFGFTMTFIMPLLDGVPMVLCPDPTDIKTLARVCAQYKTTILMGTPTFLRAIAINRWVHPMCLDSLRYIIAGAEKLRPEMRETFKLKFGKDLYEGYGCTELTPLAAINAPNVLLDDFLTMEKCSDNSSIGLPPPGTVTAIINPETNEFLRQGEEGMLVVTGPQVMKGYLKDEAKTSSVILEIDGRRWYKTGDKCTITKDGFIQILGRYSRFAKLGGEMISLTAVELRIAETGILGDHEFAITAVPDSVKGERIVLLVKGDATLDTEEISRSLRKSGIPPLMQPGSVFGVEAIPKLGSGKWDFNGMKKLATELVEKK